VDVLNAATEPDVITAIKDYSFLLMENALTTALKDILQLTENVLNA